MVMTNAAFFQVMLEITGRTIFYKTVITNRERRDRDK